MGSDAQAKPVPRDGLVKPLVCFSALNAAHRGLALLLLPLYMRYIPAQEYAVLASVTIVAGIVGAVANLKLDAAMRTFYFDYSGDELRDYLRQAMSLSVYTALAVYALMLLVGRPLFGAVFAHEELRFYPAGAIALATSCLGSCLSTYFAYLRNSMNLSELIRWQSLTLFTTALLQVLLLTVFGLGIYAVLLGTFVPSALAFVLFCATRPDLIGRSVSYSVLRPSLRYGVPLVALGFLYALGTRADRFVIERYSDLTTLGAYTILMALFGVQQVILDSMDNAVRPRLYRALRSDADPAAKPVIESCQRLYLAAGLLALSLSVFAGTNVEYFTHDATYLSIRQWLVLAATALAPTVFVRYVSLVLESRKQSLTLSFGIMLRLAILGLGLFVLVPIFGVSGALAALLLAGLALSFVFWLAAVRTAAQAPSIRIAGVQIGVFVATVWLLQAALRSTPPPLFGAAQLLSCAALLVGLNLRDIRRLHRPGHRPLAAAQLPD